VLFPLVDLDGEYSQFLEGREKKEKMSGESQNSAALGGIMYAIQTVHDLEQARTKSEALPSRMGARRGRPREGRL
jgi:hypothetical protein